MTRQSLPRIAAGAALAGLVSLAASPAFAAGSTTVPRRLGAGTAGASTTTPGSPSTPSAAAGTAALAKIQAAAKLAIDGRVATLNKAIAVINATPYLGADGPILVGKAQADVTALTALEATIEADTTAQQAKTDAQTILTDFRVYALVVPVDHMVRAADGVTAIVTKLTAIETKWSGLNDPSIASLLADMQTQTQAAATAVTGLPATLEGFTPDQWNANHGLLSGPRAQLGTARQDLGKARQDAKQIVAILHAEHQKGASSVSSSTTSTSVTG